MEEDNRGFTGYCERTIDDKGRLSIPSKFRAQIEEMQGKDQPVLIYYAVEAEAIRIYTRAAWNRFAQPKIDAIEDGDVKAKIQRSVFRHLDDQKMDSQGRILLDKKYLKQIGIDRSVGLTGMSRTIEIRALELLDEEEELTPEEIKLKKSILF